MIVAFFLTFQPSTDVYETDFVLKTTLPIIINDGIIGKYNRSLPTDNGGENRFLHIQKTLIMLYIAGVAISMQIAEVSQGPGSLLQ